MVETDAEQLKQVVVNLTMNAIQAMPDGGTIVVSVHREGEGVAIRVKDEGLGISEDDLPKVFDPFFTTKVTGTGLGLSVALRIVGQLGGTIEASRNHDKGMTFTVMLPIEAKKEIE